MKGHTFRCWLIRCALGACWTLANAVASPPCANADGPAPRATLGAPVEPVPAEAGTLLVQYPAPFPLATGSQPAAIGFEPAVRYEPGFESAEPPTLPPSKPSAPAPMRIANTPQPPPAAPPVIKQVPPATTWTLPAREDVAVPPTGQPVPATAPIATLGPLVVFPRNEPGLQRKSYVDLTAAPCFAHAPDYKWIIGRVEYSSVGKEWRLRYASVDEADRFGGRVALVQDQHVDYLVDGLYIQVRGHLVNTDNAGHGPVYYRIEWFQAVQDPNRVQQPLPAQ